MQAIHTVAGIICNEQGAVLLVRKRGSSIFIQPGGKTEPDEDPISALTRELEEELGVNLVLPSVVYLGEFEDVAVNEPGRRVKAKAFYCRVHGTPVAQAEIEEACWLMPNAPYPVPVAPLSARHILPALIAFKQRTAANGSHST